MRDIEINAVSTTFGVNVERGQSHLFEDVEFSIDGVSAFFISWRLFYGADSKDVYKAISSGARCYLSYIREMEKGNA